VIVELVKSLTDKYNNTFYDYTNKRLSSEYFTSAINDDNSYMFKTQNKLLGYPVSWLRFLATEASNVNIPPSPHTHTPTKFMNFEKS
jgi:hypothetical protein